MALIDELIKEGWLKTPRIIEAFRKIKRADFMPDDIKNLAELNEALPIGCGQTISQPLVVAFMLEELALRPGDRVLDVGSGSGWTTALLAEIVGEKGKVIALDLLSEMKEFGERNVSRYGFVKEGRVRFVCADGSKGYEETAPFDRILCSASVQGSVPESWKSQLKVGGIIVTPVGSSIWKLVKKSEKDFEEKEYPGFAFVPLVTENK